MRHVRDTVPGCRRSRKRRSGLDSGQSPLGHGFDIVSSRHRSARAGKGFRAPAVAPDARGGPRRAQVARRPLGKKRSMPKPASSAPYGINTARKRHVLAPWRPVYGSLQGLARGLGTPNIYSHSVTCTRNVEQACASVLGLDRGRLVIDYRRRNTSCSEPQRAGGPESCGESRGITAARANGCKVTSWTSAPPSAPPKRTPFFFVRPGHRLRHEPCGAARADFGKAL